jgi:N-methylhydantoinase A
MYFIGVDIGGTFTDCVAVDEHGRVYNGKALSTHSTSPVHGVMEGLERLAEEAGTTVDDLLGDADRLSHGTTIGTNLVVERNGARVGLLATRGHGDALLMMRGNGRTAGAANDQVFSVHNTDKPTPLVPRRLVGEVSERVVKDGSVLSPLDEDGARSVIATLVDEGVDAIAIALMWGFRNPVHEKRLRELVAEVRPELFVSISSETSPRQGEYERTVATVINSYVGPASSAYLEDLAEELGRHGLGRRPFIMQSNGGVVPVDVAQRTPVQTIGSGPAGGLAGTISIAEASGHRNVIATDMGGTSFEVGLVIDGRPVMASEQVLDNYTFQISQLDLRSIACGGGSIAYVDPHSGGLRVGPRSAGADPGPACYGRGTEPTVTDADVVLGLISPEQFLGGRMELDRDASVRAVQGLADELGLTLEEAAGGILRVNSNNAATLIRQRTIEQGLDPRDFVVYAFGGAGPVHAFSYAKELGISEVVIPMGNGASTLSAYGIAASDVMRTFEHESAISAPFDAKELSAVVTALEDRARAAMADAGFDPDALVMERVAMARYAEQFMQELLLPIPAGKIDDDVAAGLQERFVAEYSRLYGEAAVAVFQAIEIFAIRISANLPLGFAPLTGEGRGAANGSPTTPDGKRDVYWPDAGEWISTDLYSRALAPGEQVAGPAIVQLPHTGVSVAPGQHLAADAVGSLILSL